MELASATQSEIRLTIEVAFQLANALADGALDVRRTLDDAGFSRAADASAASIDRMITRLNDLTPLLVELHRLETTAASKRINEQLTELPIAPSISEHDGLPAHIHWTPTTAT
ncbi:MAG: CGNR zinc finger domain-containing protein, partial [Candidatus Neomicrothrix subdominans]